MATQLYARRVSHLLFLADKIVLLLSKRLEELNWGLLSESGMLSAISFCLLFLRGLRNHQDLDTVTSDVWQWSRWNLGPCAYQPFILIFIQSYLPNPGNNLMIREIDLEGRQNRVHVLCHHICLSQTTQPQPLPHSLTMDTNTLILPHWLWELTSMRIPHPPGSERGYFPLA